MNAASKGTGELHMLNTLILMAFVETIASQGSAIHCEFPGKEAAQKPIHVVLEPRPSLKDQPGLFRVVMEMNGRMSLKAAAQPILSTGERDVLIRGTTRRNSMYTIGLRDDGKAALNMQTRQAGDSETLKSTRIGACRGYMPYLERWLPS